MAHDYSPNFSGNKWLFVLTHTKLGEGEKVVELLQNIATNSDFDILRDDPRFLKIVDDIGLTSYHKRKAK